MNTFPAPSRSFRKAWQPGVLSLLIVPALALAAPPPPSCLALVDVHRSLETVNASGSVVTRFTVGMPHHYAVLSPDGRRLAYTLRSTNMHTHIRVINSYGRQGIYRIYRNKRSLTGHRTGAYGPLDRMMWSSNRVLELVKHISPYASRFAFRRIDASLRPYAHPLDRHGFGDDCAANRNLSRIACVFGDIEVNGKSVYIAHEFQDSVPMASLTLAAGTSAMTSGHPSFRVKVVRIYKHSVELKITPPNGVWVEGFVTRTFTRVSFSWRGFRYGFSARVLRSNPDMIRIHVVKSDWSGDLFDPAIAWLPHDRGLLVIRRYSDRRASFYVLRPRRGKKQWARVGVASVNDIPNDYGMSFETPSLLLVDTLLNGSGSYHDFYEIPISIHERGGRGDRVRIRVGAITKLPRKVAVNVDGTVTKAGVIDWACGASGRGGDDDDGD